MKRFTVYVLWRVSGCDSPSQLSVEAENATRAMEIAESYPQVVRVTGWAIED